ncbi:MAG: hypothetical protein J6C87_08010, partial [Bacteroides sp.]|nr:hypothetical protein [Bacteroides sp.]
SSIYTYLLLSSEVKGNIELPETYFKENTKESEQNLDLLMLTQGWRRYDISKLVRGKLKQPDTAPEIGQEINGQVVSEYSGKPFEKAPVLMIIPGVRFYEEKVTDTLGRFSFNHLEFPDSTQYILRGLTQKEKSHDVLMKIEEDAFPQVPKFTSILPLLNRSTVKNELNIDVLSDSTMRMIELDEVRITASFKRRDPIPGILSMANTTSVDAKYFEKRQVTDEMYDLLNSVPYVICSNAPTEEGGNLQIKIRESNSNLIGSEWKLEKPKGGTLLMIDNIVATTEEILNLDPMDVDEIRVVRKLSGSMFAMEEYSSLLVVYTNPNSRRVKRFAKVNISGYTPLGYQRPVAYYSPKYIAEVKGKNDNRHTLHWQLNVAVDQEGKSSFNFYTGDKTGNYTVVVQGVTHDGEIIHAKKQFKVVENGE